MKVAISYDSRRLYTSHHITLSLSLLSIPLILNRRLIFNCAQFIRKTELKQNLCRSIEHRFSIDECSFIVTSEDVCLLFKEKLILILITIIIQKRIWESRWIMYRSSFSFNPKYRTINAERSTIYSSIDNHIKLNSCMLHTSYIYTHKDKYRVCTWKYSSFFLFCQNAEHDK
jgi:hypothetical protein